MTLWKGSCVKLQFIFLFCPCSRFPVICCAHLVPFHLIKLYHAHTFTQLAPPACSSFVLFPFLSTRPAYSHLELIQFNQSLYISHQQTCTDCMCICLPIETIQWFPSQFPCSLLNLLIPHIFAPACSLLYSSVSPCVGHLFHFPDLHISLNCRCCKLKNASQFNRALAIELLNWPLISTCI